MKKILVHNVLLSSPNFSERFRIHTDAIKTKPGGVISQNGKPIAFYSHKLTPAQINYKNKKIELLSIVETFKWFRTTILGHYITVYGPVAEKTRRGYPPK